MVWENVKADRALSTVYTNTNDVPLYVQVYVVSNTGNENCQMWIDGAKYNTHNLPHIKLTNSCQTMRERTSLKYVWLAVVRR